MTIINICLIIIAVKAIIEIAESFGRIYYCWKEYKALQNNLNDAKERFFGNMEGLEHLMRQNDDRGIS